MGGEFNENRGRTGNAFLILAFLACFSLPDSPAAAQTPPRLEFTRLLAHWDSYGDPEYLAFISQARPEVVQVGFYGASFYSLADTPWGKGYPMNLPTEGLARTAAFFENLNAEIHKRHAKVVGHFNVKYLFGDPDSKEGPRGFFKWYRDSWDEAALGPRPVADPVELLEKNADGTPITNASYSIGKMGEYWGCLNNPHWRAVLKAWVKIGIHRGVDGFISNYFYRHNCVCSYCQAEFRAYLKDRFPAAQLKEQFGVTDIDRHVFLDIESWHDPKVSTPFKREMLRFSQIANKKAFDEVFVQYGRSLKPDLILAQWNHLGNFQQISGDERCLLPAELWGQDEDYLWYSTGDAAHWTDLAQGELGEGTLQARYIRGAFGGKPFTLGKYESTRTRVSIAELAANGGAPMGFYTRFRDPAARAEIVRYYNFIEKHDRLFRANTPYADAVLLYPRRSVHDGNLSPVETFKQLGKQLLDRHVLLDVRPDDAVTEAQLKAYRNVIRVSEGIPAKLDLTCRVVAPPTVRVSASRPADGTGITLHFVNYNRTEPPGKRNSGSGIKDEQPIVESGVGATLILPPGVMGRRVTVMTPEAPEPVAIESASNETGVVAIHVPPFLVYCVVQVE